MFKMKMDIYHCMGLRECERRRRRGSRRKYKRQVGENEKRGMRREGEGRVWEDAVEKPSGESKRNKPGQEIASSLSFASPSEI